MAISRFMHPDWLMKELKIGLKLSCENLYCDTVNSISWTVSNFSNIKMLNLIKILSIVFRSRSSFVKC